MQGYYGLIDLGDTKPLKNLQIFSFTLKWVSCYHGMLKTLGLSADFALLWRLFARSLQSLRIFRSIDHQYKKVQLTEKIRELRNARFFNRANQLERVHSGHGRCFGCILLGMWILHVFLFGTGSKFFSSFFRSGSFWGMDPSAGIMLFCYLCFACPAGQ